MGTVVALSLVKPPLMLLTNTFLQQFVNTLGPYIWTACNATVNFVKVGGLTKSGVLGLLGISLSWEGPTVMANFCEIEN